MWNDNRYTDQGNTVATMIKEKPIPVFDILRHVVGLHMLHFKITAESI